jgi:hypothetical protein
MTATAARHQGDQIGLIFPHRAIFSHMKFFFENYKSSPHFGATFFRGYGYLSIITKMGWATFWAIFSQTHLVTLLITSRCARLSKSPTKPFSLNG